MIASTVYKYFVIGTLQLKKYVVFFSFNGNKFAQKFSITKNL